MSEHRSVPLGVMKSWTTTCVLLVCTPSLAQHTAPSEPSAVRLESTSVVIPTYQVGAPDTHPMFYNHESYQGAQKRIYPYPLQDDLTYRREDRTYTSLELENDFLGSPSCRNWEVACFRRWTRPTITTSSITNM